MNLDRVVPWGRSFKEYCSIFSLSGDDLQKRLLGCGDGPASFNAELSQRGGNIVSIDPVFQFSVEQIRSRIDEVYPQIMSQMEQNAESYIWESIRDVSELGRLRMAAMQQFLSDYNSGKEAGRYIAASLPVLPFEDQQFELALCSHYLFLYSDQVSLTDHVKSLLELCRVAKEIRVYPLLALNGELSPHVKPAISELEELGHTTELVEVPYQFQKSATQMLVVNTCLKSGNPMVTPLVR